MLLTAPDIIFCISKAREFTEYYKAHSLNGAATRRSVEEFLDLCAEYLGKPIEKRILEIPAEACSIRGFYISYPDKYEIYLMAGMNFCWSRFVLCKELFHVILDEERYQTTNIYAHLEEVMTSFPSTQPGGPAAVSEALAEIAAMEFMFPYADRAPISLPLADSLEIAERYKVPQAKIEEYMGQSFMVGLKHYMESR